MMDNTEQKKDIATAKKTKDKSIKKKSKKTKKKKKTKVGGVTININVGGGGKSATKQPKAPRAARGFVPRSTSLRGQQKVQRNVDDKFGRETAGNLWQGVYGVRSQVTGLSGDVDTIRSKVDFLGNYILNSRQQPASVQHRVPPQNITLNVPNPPGIEDMRRVADTIINNQATASRAIDQLSTNMEASTENIATGIMYTAKEVKKLADGTNAANIVGTLYDEDTPQPEESSSVTIANTPPDDDDDEKATGMEPAIKTVPPEEGGGVVRKTRKAFNMEANRTILGIALLTKKMNKTNRGLYYSIDPTFQSLLKQGYETRAIINKMDRYRKDEKLREAAETTFMGSEDK